MTEITIENVEEAGIWIERLTGRSRKGLRDSRASFGFEWKKKRFLAVSPDKRKVSWWPFGFSDPVSSHPNI